jgi:hypothetical protein
MSCVVGVRRKNGEKDTPFIPCELLLSQDVRNIGTKQAQNAMIRVQLQFTMGRKQTLQHRFSNR